MDSISNASLLIKISNDSIDNILDNLINISNSLISEYYHIITWDLDPILIKIFQSTTLFVLECANKFNLEILKINTGLYVGLFTLRYFIENSIPIILQEICE